MFSPDGTLISASAAPHCGVFSGYNLEPEYCLSLLALSKIQKAIAPHEDLLTIVKRRKLQWFPWTCLPFVRSGQNHLAKHSERGQKTTSQGRRKKRWEDNIREWTGLEFAESQKGSREQRKMEETGCVKSPVVPQQRGTQDGVYKPQFLKRKESRSGSNRDPSADQPSAFTARPHRLTGWKQSGLVPRYHYTQTPRGQGTGEGEVGKEEASLM